ncbi:triose-phosphate isomerase [Candidatus Woesearchaeota archaeon]|nr:triose-phosphate isomerase [Candidatus Woesearchaeota archaeon]
MAKILNEPFIIINYKTYPSGTGRKAEDTAKACIQQAQQAGKQVIIAAQAADIYRLSRLSAPIIAQHIDPVDQGKNTGFITAESVKEAGAIGTLINHAEHKISIQSIQQTVEKAHKNGLLAIACAATTREAEAIAKPCSPDYIAIEPPELIGGNISVSKARPEIITETIQSVRKIRPIPVICGAGINGKEDVKKAVELGTKGVLVANYVMGAEDRKKAVEELVSGL